MLAAAIFFTVGVPLIWVIVIANAATGGRRDSARAERLRADDVYHGEQASS